MIKLNGHPVTPTIFPDSTSQVWKVDNTHFFNLANVITWEFENEAEFMHVAQLKTLIEVKVGPDIDLELPYLPYARQDKAVTNLSTFAFYPFCHLLNFLNFKSIWVFDPHNVEEAKRMINNIEVAVPDTSRLLRKLKALPVYPDAGAANRYEDSYSINKVLRCEKVREPLTGEITGVKVIGKVQKKSYLIVDDICDGGRTFIEVAKKLYLLGAKEVHLYVSHGIFSKGLKPLREVGIKRIFTHKGEVK